MRRGQSIVGRCATGRVIRSRSSGIPRQRDFCASCSAARNIVLLLFNRPLLLNGVKRRVWRSCCETVVRPGDAPLYPRITVRADLVPRHVKARERRAVCGEHLNPQRARRRGDDVAGVNLERAQRPAAEDAAVIPGGPKKDTNRRGDDCNYYD